MTRGKLYTRYKFIFYVMSLGLLFFLIFLLTIRIPNYWSPYAAPIEFWELLCQNWFAHLSLLVSAGICWYARRVHRRFKSQDGCPAYKILEIENVNYEYLTFLTTYIMPLVCMDFQNPRYILVFFILLVIIGFVFIKTDLYYGNPTLALIGYRLYRATIEKDGEPTKVIMITRDKLDKNDSVEWNAIDEKVFVVRRQNNE